MAQDRNALSRRTFVVGAAGLGATALGATTLVPATPAAADAGDAAHVVLGWLMLALVALHVVAALYHRLVLRDGVLGRMAPALEREGAGRTSR